MTVMDVLRAEFGPKGVEIFRRLEEIARDAAKVTEADAAIYFDPPGGCFGRKPRCGHEARTRPSEN